MDLSPTPPNTIKTPEDTNPETTPEAQPTNSLSFTNGSLNRHHSHQLPPPPPLPPPSSMVASYRECLKNHAASIGGHALDGCGEFMPSPWVVPSDPTSLKCAACGCHRNFHRRYSENPPISGAGKIIGFHQHRLYPSPPLRPPHGSSSPSLSPSRSSSLGRAPSPQSPPPVSHRPPSYFASPPQMLLALRTGYPGPPSDQTAATEKSNGRKRFRTKFSQEQKEKMHSFAEKLGWKMVKSDEGTVENFCNEVGIGKGVLKVWMHNNKHTLRKKGDPPNLQRNVDDDTDIHNHNHNLNDSINGCGGDRTNNDQNCLHRNREDRKADFNLFSNGSSSSSPSP